MCEIEIALLHLEVKLVPLLYQLSRTNNNILMMTFWMINILYDSARTLSQSFLNLYTPPPLTSRDSKIFKIKTRSKFLVVTYFPLRLFNEKLRSLSVENFHRFFSHRREFPHSFHGIFSCATTAFHPFLLPTFPPIREMEVCFLLIF